MTTRTRLRAYNPRWITTPALVEDVEITLPSISISPDEQYRAIRALLRVHGRPVGYADINATSIRSFDRVLLLAALDPDTVERATEHLLDDLRRAGVPLLTARPCLADLLDTLTAAGKIDCCAATPNNGPLVSVAICTLDRAWSIGATLNSLLHQTYTNIEVLVIDNGSSSDETKRLVNEKYPAFRYIYESRLGLNHARNRAMREARGKIVAFIDDDGIADPGWVQALVPLFDDPAVMCATGLVAPAQLDTPGQDLFERYGYSKGFYRVEFRLDAPPPNLPGFPYKGYLGTGCNCALRRTAYDLIGPFDPRLDMGTPVPGGGDHDIFARIIRAGYTLVYDPGPVVFHQHLADLEIVVKRLGQYQESFLAFITKSILSDRARALRLARHMIYWYCRKTARGIAAVLTKHDRPFALVLSEALGAWRGPLALYRSHRRSIRQQTTQEVAPIMASPPDI
jgi:glycosyltransferase involved in cell wall biosynthesis